MARARASLPTLIGSLAILLACGPWADAQTLTLAPSYGRDTLTAPPAPPQITYWVKGYVTIESYDTGFDRYTIRVRVTQTNGQPRVVVTSEINGSLDPAGGANVVDADTSPLTAIARLCVSRLPVVFYGLRLAGYGRNWPASKLTYSMDKVIVPVPPANGDTYKIAVTAILYKGHQAFPVEGQSASVTNKP
jgi:hypothetical protein